MDGTKVLVRSREGRMVAGVLAYLAAWAIIPEEGEKTSVAERLISKDHSTSAR
jgi:phage shock protein PspC (stress-responsive transcriptional regulator)